MKRQPRVPFRAWARYHLDSLGVGVAAGVSLLLIAIVAVFLVPSGHSTGHAGVVTGFGSRESETGSRRVMHILVDGVPDTIRARSHLDCRRGDIVRIKRTPHWWGATQSVSLADTKPCYRPPPFRH